MKNPSLWEKICYFQLDDPGSDFSFSMRLARENDWPLGYALRAIGEYKKFMYLICAYNQSFTPSDEVDQVWHLHLVYTQSYWKEFCQDTLGREVHHGPTKGGQSERNKYNTLYENTIKVYKQEFKQAPPSDIWPEPRLRFKFVNFSRVNRHTHLVIKIPRLFHK